MLRCLGIPVTEPTCILGDNMSVIQNATNPDMEIKKKHVSISFHVVREAIAADVIEPWWVEGESNISDIMTKQLPCDQHTKHCFTLFPSSQSSLANVMDILAMRAHAVRNKYLLVISL